VSGEESAANRIPCEDHLLGVIIVTRKLFDDEDLEAEIRNESFELIPGHPEMGITDALQKPLLVLIVIEMAEHPNRFSELAGLV
jgi:hypothetical protein